MTSTRADDHRHTPLMPWVKWFVLGAGIRWLGLDPAEVFFAFGGLLFALDVLHRGLGLLATADGA